MPKAPALLDRLAARGDPGGSNSREAVTQRPPLKPVSVCQQYGPKVFP